MRSLLYAMALMLCTTLASGAGSRPLVSDAWIREAPPGAGMTAAYLTITNLGDNDLILQSVTSPQFSNIMMHRSVVVDGMARMTHEYHVHIPAHDRMEFKPGGYHLMMSAPQTPLVAGDTVLLVLHFDDGQQLEVKAEVRKP